MAEGVEFVWGWGSHPDTSGAPMSFAGVVEVGGKTKRI